MARVAEGVHYVEADPDGGLVCRAAIVTTRAPVDAPASLVVFPPRSPIYFVDGAAYGIAVSGTLESGTWHVRCECGPDPDPIIPQIERAS